ncbi:hypothetical protein CJ030_MR4G018823 [Morella rubra]|uniref:Uncharacterized protein n=1 Tax=Morella rubra TaxID=262757 RepID=A0A6A1VQV3_9ROSI|nr:hypothetical protein CJ030_MR4G018823 [Morella rubra]
MNIILPSASGIVLSQLVILKLAFFALYILHRIRSLREFNGPALYGFGFGPDHMDPDTSRRTKKLETTPRIKRCARKCKNTASFSRPRRELLESADLTNFRNDDCATAFDTDFAKRTVIRGRNITLDLIGELDLYGHFQFQGLENLCEMGRYVYLKYVRQFFANMTWTRDVDGLTIRSLVGRKLVELTVEKLSEIMRIPCRREHVYEQKVRPQENKWDYWDASRFLLDLDDDEDALTHFQAKDLKLSLRLLHLISTYNFLPRGGHRGVVTFMDVYMLEHLVNHRSGNCWIFQGAPCVSGLEIAGNPEISARADWLSLSWNSRSSREQGALEFQVRGCPASKETWNSRSSRAQILEIPRLLEHNSRVLSTLEFQGAPCIRLGIPSLSARWTLEFQVSLRATP